MPHNDQEAPPEEVSGQIPSRWQRIKEHRAFKPGLAVVGFVAVAGIALVTSRLNEETDQFSAAPWERLPESMLAASEGVGDGTSRKSPNEHMVNGHQRLQKYGPGGTQMKVVQVSSYSRGNSAE